MFELKLMKALRALKEYSTINNADSMVSRSGANKAGSIGRKRGKGGAEIQDLLGIEDEGHSKLSDSQPLSMMDVVLQVWTGETPKPGDEGENNEKPEKNGLPFLRKGSK